MRRDDRGRRVSHAVSHFVPKRVRQRRGGDNCGRRNPLNTRNARSRKPAESGRIGLGDRRSEVQILSVRQMKPQVRSGPLCSGLALYTSLHRMHTIRRTRAYSVDTEA